MDYHKKLDGKDQKQEIIKNVKIIDDATFERIMRKVLSENSEAIKRLSKK